MADSANGRSSFWTQSNALFRKNLSFQKRNCGVNIRLVLFPLLLYLLLVLIQAFVNEILDKPSGECVCNCVDQNGDGTCQTVCDIPYSTSEKPADCPIPSPPEWPPMLQVPSPAYRAAKADFLPFGDLPNDSCRSLGSCPASILLTGMNHSLGESLGRYLFPNPPGSKLSRRDLAGIALGSKTKTQFPEPAFAADLPIFYLQSHCGANSTLSISTRIASEAVNREIRCVQGLQLWRNSSSDINDELYKGYMKGNSEGRIDEILAGYDLLNSNMNNYNVTIWYNSTDDDDSGNDPSGLLRVPRSLNMVSNAFLQLLLGPSAKIQFDFVKEMPKHETQLRLDLSSLLGPMFYTWVILQLFPVVLSSLVYEKQQNLRIMMKMHGLGDGAYLMISYAYFLLLSSVYLFVFVLFGSVIGLKFFTLNSYGIQLVFYLVYANLQVASAFLVAALFSNVKTATVIGYILVFGTGLLGGYLFEFFLQQNSLSRGWLVVLQLYPGFSLYRGLYEFSEYAFAGNYIGTDGMRWGDLSDSSNGMKETLVLMFVEWLIVIFAAYYIDQVWSSGSGVQRSPLFFLDSFRKKPSLTSFRKPSLRRQGSKVFVQLEKPDVGQERERVEQLLLESETSHGIICDDLKKVYPGRDGNPEKFAVRGLSLALAQGECFGMLGPNGAGKTTFINMMTGLITPSSGVAFVNGLDIRTSKDDIYSNMGVCPQHDLLWETLTGREHLLFYGRLKNLKGAALTRAVDESLKSVNLFNGGVADRQAGKYSGGMKRRLSVAISLIGDPKVVYMDEPSTGLDPASRNNLWNVVKRAKQDRAIVLTTHSMEEAEHLCDRLGIFVDGSLECIGNPKELKSRYGGSYVFTMTTSPNHEEEVENLVRGLSPNANKIYQISGTLKFEIPKQEVRIAEVFRAVENAKRRFEVQAWGIADTTLEDVFVKVAKGAQAFNVLS